MLTDKLHLLGIMLPPVSGPFGSYVPARRVGNLIFVAGQLPMKEGKLMAMGQAYSPVFDIVTNPTAVTVEVV